MSAEITRRGLALGAAAVGLSAPAWGQTPPADDPERIAVTVRRIASFQPGDGSRRRFGALEFRSGLVLSAGEDTFGGFSGLSRSADGSRLVAVSDRGRWLTATLRREGGALAGLSDAMLSPMLNASGRPLPGTRGQDTEALCIEGGVAYVGVERTHEILRFDWARRGTAARGMPIPAPPEIRRLPRNRGLEALGVAPARLPIGGAIVAISERSGGEDEPTAGWIIGGPRPGAFRYRRRDGYDVTDLAFLPEGDMLVLERWYKPWRGVGMRIRRIEGASIQPGALLDGPILIDADLGQEIDNMEGMSLHREDALTIVTLISDDNFSALQRTILLEFVLTGS